MAIETSWTDYLQGSTRLDFICEGRSVSHVDGIVPVTLRFGAARVRADAIAGLGTEEGHRRQGYARQVMDAAISHMAEGEAGLSVLHGIRDFYHRFGYVSAGPSYVLSVGTTVNAALTMPLGFRGRACTEEDIPALQRLYDSNTRDAAGAAIRPPGGFVWAKLKASLPADECRVVEDVQGQVVAYAWRARDCWAVRAFDDPNDSDSFTVGEVMAVDALAADAILAACRAWAAEEVARTNEPIEQLRFPQPPVGPVAAAAKLQQAFSLQRYQPHGGFMARIINLERLLTALSPELTRRHQESSLAFSGVLSLHTEIGTASLPLNYSTAAGRKQEISVSLTQGGLTRLVFGTTTPDDVLDREGISKEDLSRPLFRVLFPPACPHIYLPDQC